MPPSTSGPVPDPGHSTALEVPAPRGRADAELVRARVLERLLGEPTAATRVGRFTLLERLGSGGMGIVYAAYDPELDRRVALKLLRPDRGGADLTARIMREAQAMARVSHPNVAQVYEVGRDAALGDATVFIALEFIRGRTLRAWQSAQARTWREVIDVYVQSARGLVAAHAAGLVHRDFKPDNAMLGDDGRVRVLDFGLARSAGDTSLVSGDASATTDDASAATPMTAAGAVLGTPAYMAPEQFLGEETTAATDQFAFCVAAWEALFGERPFAGASRAELIAAVSRGQLREPARSIGVPPWIRAALTRGLATDPSARFASMNELVEALLRDPSKRRRRLFVAATALASFGAAIGGGVLYARQQERAAVQACSDDAAVIDTVWADPMREAVHSAFAATGVGHAETTATNTIAALDRWAEAWRSDRVQACLTTTVARTWSEDVGARAHWCLEEHRARFEDTIAQFSKAGVALVGDAVKVASELEATAPCLDTAVLARISVPPASMIDDVEATRGALRSVRVALGAGDFAGAATQLDEVMPIIDASAWPPNVAEAHELRGRALLGQAMYEEASDAYDAAWRAAATGQAWAIAARVAKRQLQLHGFELEQIGPALVWNLAAETAEALAGDRDGLLTSQRLHTLAGALSRARRNDEAEAAALEAIAILERRFGPDEVALAPALAALGSVYSKASRYGDMIAPTERAIALYERYYGPDHPDVGRTWGNLSIAYQGLRDDAAARVALDKAMAVLENHLGPDHPDVANGLINGGHLLMRMGDVTAAEQRFERALVIYERAFGMDHRRVAVVLEGLADARARLGDRERATADYGRALAIRERDGRDHASTGGPLLGLAKLAIDAGRTSEAVELATRAMAVREGGGENEIRLAEARMILASALVETADPRSCARAVELATKAHATIAGQRGREKDTAEVEGVLQAARACAAN